MIPWLSNSRREKEKLISKARCKSPALERFWSQFEIFSFYFNLRKKEESTKRAQGRKHFCVSFINPIEFVWKWNRKNLHSIYFFFIHPLDSMHNESHIWSKRAFVKENRTFPHLSPSAMLSQNLFFTAERFFSPKKKFHML